MVCAIQSLNWLLIQSQQLHFVEDPTLTTETGQSVAGRIQVLMGDIEKDINDTGNLINKVGHARGTVYFILSIHVSRFDFW